MPTSADLLALLRRFEVIEETAVVAGSQDQSAEDAGAAWVSLGLLTRFQLDALLRGNGDRLRIGPYLLLDRLGTGGMGEVFRARHLRLGREVALKVIRQDKLTSATATARFLRELRATARVEHPNVVRVFNAGRDIRHFYFSMEYVRGASLAELVNRDGPFTVVEACRAVGDAALGLEAVHAAGLVHRDIKPANLVREGATGRTKVLDLGLAGLMVRSDVDSGTGTLTQNGAVLGTPDYMAPEQAINSHGADHRCDLYSLGCTLVFLLTGKPVFPSGSPVEKLFKHAYTAPPDLSSTRPDVPPALSAVAARLLAKLPEDRFPSASAVADALRPFATFTPTIAVPAYVAEEFEPLDEPFAFESPVAEESSQSEETPRRRRPRRIWPRVLAASFLLSLFVIAGILVLRPAKNVPSPSTDVAVSPAEEKLAGLRLALGKPGADVPKLRGELYALLSEHRGGPHGVAIAKALRAVPSPLDDLKPIDGSSGKPPLVAVRMPRGPRHWGPAHAVAVSSNGEVVATVGADRLVRLWSATNGQPLRTLAGFDDPVFDVTFSPDGRHVAATSRLVSVNDTEGFERKARVWDIATGELLLTVGKNQEWVVGWRYNPTGKTALAGRYDILRLWSAKDGKVLKEMSGKSCGTNWITWGDFSRDGKFALAACNNFHVHVWDLSTGEEVRAWKAADWYFDGFDRSLTDDRILTVADGRIRLWDWTTGNKLSEHQFAPIPVKAVFSPDGKRVFAGCMDGRLCLIDRAIDRRGELVAGHDGPVTGLTWASEKRAYSVGRDGTLRRWDLSGDRPIELDPPPTVRPATALCFTDEDRSLVIARPGQPPEVWDVSAPPAAPADPGEPLGEPGAVAISPDGRRVATIVSGSTIRVWAIPVGGIRDFRDFDTGIGSPVASLVWFPDSKRLLVGPRDSQAQLTVLEAASGRVLSRLPAGKEGIDVSLVVSADGNWAAAALRNGDVGWWELQAGKVAGEVPRIQPQSAVAALNFSPSHRNLRVFGGGWQVTDLPVGSVRPGRQFWDADPTVVSGGVVSADGGITAVSAKSGEVVLLSESGKRLREWKLTARVTAMAFSANGRFLAAAHADGGVGVYRAP